MARRLEGSLETIVQQEHTYVIMHALPQFVFVSVLVLFLCACRIHLIMSFFA